MRDYYINDGRQKFYNVGTLLSWTVVVFLRRFSVLFLLVFLLFLSLLLVVAFHRRVPGNVQVLKNYIVFSPFTVKQQCVINKCISNNDNFSFGGIGFLY